MKAQSRQALDAMLAGARQAAALRRRSVSEASDGALRRVLGISDSAICRRVAMTPRVSRRIADKLRTMMQEDEDTSLGALLADDLPTNPDAVRFVDEAGEGTPTAPSSAEEATPTAVPLPEAERLIRLVAAAIRLSSTGAILGREDLDGALSLYGVEAVDFALQNRGRVPDWMREAAGGRSDMHGQLAATCIVCLAESTGGAAAEAVIRDAQAYDPLPIGAGEARDGAVRLGAEAVAFAASYDPDASGDPDETM